MAPYDDDDDADAGDDALDTPRAGVFVSFLFMRIIFIDTLPRRCDAYAMMAMAMPRQLFFFFFDDADDGAAFFVDIFHYYTALADIIFRLYTAMLLPPLPLDFSHIIIFAIIENIYFHACFSPALSRAVAARRLFARAYTMPPMIIFRRALLFIFRRFHCSFSPLSSPLFSAAAADIIYFLSFSLIFNHHFSMLLCCHDIYDMAHAFC